MLFVHWLFLACSLLAAGGAAWHALIFKRDPRAAWGWIAICLIFPLFGALLYILFGVNRVRTRGNKLSDKAPFEFRHDLDMPSESDKDILANAPEDFELQARTSFAISGRPLLGGNSMEVLYNGEQNYPLMLEAIENAKEKVYLATYIFESNKTGKQFADALGRAKRRGVDVRVVLDGIGNISSLPRGSKVLKKQNVPLAMFMPPRLFPPNLSVNLRCHHKILVADEIGFTGGMNIGDRYLASGDSPARVQDIHFRVKGPIVSHLEEVFLWDWGFARNSDATPPSSLPSPAGNVICRAISDGPHESHDKLPAIISAACSAAKQSICIMTPYFLPPRELVGAIQSAAQRGVRVEIVLPEVSDHRLVDHSTRNMLWELLIHGVHVYFQPPPFAHSKLMLVDNQYSLIGSTNMDPRSLRLNFEFVLEVYDGAFTRSLLEHFEEIRDKSRLTCLDEVDGRSLLVRTRDSLCWLFSPYL